MGEEGGWFVSQSAELCFDQRQGEACGRRRGLVRLVEMEGQVFARYQDEPEVTQQELTPKEDDLKDRSIFIFSLVSHVADFS